LRRGACHRGAHSRDPSAWRFASPLAASDAIPDSNVKQHRVCGRILAARIRTRVAACIALRIERGRRECRVKASPHGPTAAKKAGGSHHRFSQIIGRSLRNGFNGVFRVLPRGPGFLAPSPARRGSLCASSAPASGRQDHTPSPSVISTFVSREAVSIASRCRRS
jgi:hypothetical protein